MPGATSAAAPRREACSDAKVKALTVPSYDDLVSGKVTVSQLREVELDDLLGRDRSCSTMPGFTSCITADVIMVTGAGGSIGSRAMPPDRALPAARARALRAERVRAVRDRAGVSRAVSRAAAGVRDRRREGPRACQATSCERHRPSVVFHAAAYKHVPLMENENAGRRSATTCSARMPSPTRSGRARRRTVRVDLHRQGGESRRASWARPSGWPRWSVRRCSSEGRRASSIGALRQRARQHRQRDSEVQRADRARRAGHGHAPRDDALLHVDSRGGAARAAGGAHGRTAAKCSCSTWASRCASSIWRAT